MIFISLAACKKEGDFLIREDSQAKTAPPLPTSGPAGGLGGQVVQEGSVQDGHFLLGSTQVRAMEVGYNITLLNVNDVSVTTSIRWEEANPGSPLPPEVEVILILDEPSVGTGFIQVHAIMPDPGTGFGPTFRVVRSLSNLATRDGVEYLSSDAALTLIQDGTVRGFKIVI